MKTQIRIFILAVFSLISVSFWGTKTFAASDLIGKLITDQVLPRKKPVKSPTKKTMRIASIPTNVPAKNLFGAKKDAANLKPGAIGFYTKGCLAGGEKVPITGSAWQAMRLSRNRNWGHPKLVKLVKRLAVEARKYDGYPGLLVGDLSQPRGGPMTSGHRSHQMGLDADVWLTPMPKHVMTWAEREKKKPILMTVDRKTLNRKNWTEAHARLLKRAASYNEVSRIFVHPPIKRKCVTGPGARVFQTDPGLAKSAHITATTTIFTSASSAPKVPLAAETKRPRHGVTIARKILLTG
jgi:murein endopeptidase